MIRVKAVTLIELMVIMIIVGIVLGFGYPAYQRSTERSRTENAEFNLLSIHSAQRRRWLDKGNYYICNDNPCNLNQLRNNLGVVIRDPYFVYSIVDPQDAAGADDFEATAVRTGGRFINETLWVNQDSSEIQRSQGW